MANTYTQIYLHLVLAVHNRESLIPATIQPRIHSYMCGIISQQGHLPLAIGGIDDHVHILVGFNPTQSISDLVRDIKVNTTKFINNQHLIPFRFAWQKGFSCFSYSHSQLPSVKRYIESQYEHHKNRSIEQEMIRIYRQRDMDFDAEYIFKIE